MEEALNAAAAARRPPHATQPTALLESARRARSEPDSLGGANNSLSRAVFCVQMCASTGFSGAFVALVGTYSFVRIAEETGAMARRRNMRWYAPGAAALVGALIFGRVGMNRALDELNARARDTRLHKLAQEAAARDTPPTGDRTGER